MPRLAPGVVQPAAAHAFTGLTRAALRSLHGAGILDSASQLSVEDVVIARVARYLFWAGPSATAPGQSAERDAQRQVAKAAADQTRKMLRKGSLPRRIAVSCVDGAIYPMAKLGDPTELVFGDEPLAGPWFSVPLQQWWDEAKSLPTSEGGA